MACVTKMKPSTIVSSSATIFSVLGILLLGGANGFARPAYMYPRHQPILLHQSSNLHQHDEPDQHDKHEEHQLDLPTTPCTRICRYNANFCDGTVCIGCYREAYEIGSWADMSPQERCWTLLDAADRVPIEGGAGSGSGSGSEGNEEGSEGFGGAIAKEELLRQAQMWQQVADR